MCVTNFVSPSFPFAPANRGLQAKEVLSSWRRALLKKAEKVIEDYFTNEDRFPTASDIARQAQFLLGDEESIPWLYKNGPNASGNLQVRFLTTDTVTSNSPPTRAC